MDIRWILLVSLHSDYKLTEKREGIDNNPITSVRWTSYPLPWVPSETRTFRQRTRQIEIHWLKEGTRGNSWKGQLRHGRGGLYVNTWLSVYLLEDTVFIPFRHWMDFVSVMWDYTFFTLENVLMSCVLHKFKFLQVKIRLSNSSLFKRSRVPL